MKKPIYAPLFSPPARAAVAAAAVGIFVKNINLI
jgi:hypothetical protein